MAESTNQIAYEIDRQRETLGRHVNKLESKLQEANDWRTYVRRKPLNIALSVFSVSFLLAIAVIKK